MLEKCCCRRVSDLLPTNGFNETTVMQTKLMQFPTFESFNLRRIRLAIDGLGEPKTNTKTKFQHFCVSSALPLAKGRAFACADTNQLW